MHRRSCAGAQALGSALPPQPARARLTAGGRSSSGASQACTISQTRLRGARRSLPAATASSAGGPLEAPAARWRSKCCAAAVTSSPRWLGAPTNGSRTPDVHVVSANLPVRAGDRVGVEVTPGAAIGVRSRRTRDCDRALVRPAGLAVSAGRARSGKRVRPRAPAAGGIRAGRDIEAARRADRARGPAGPGRARAGRTGGRAERRSCEEGWPS